MPKAKEKAAAGAPSLWQPMEARQVAALPSGPGWQYEPKWDGFRCIGAKSGSAITLTSKSGKPLARYFPEIERSLAAARHRCFVVDGELCILRFSCVHPPSCQQNVTVQYPVVSFR
jgi:ATP-dependent DNA ligase